MPGSELSTSMAFSSNVDGYLSVILFLFVVAKIMQTERRIIKLA
jgi:hypothetical protein